MSGYQWDWGDGGGSNRRPHFPFNGAPQGWAPLGMGMPANPYYPNPHMMPAHALSHLNQWTPPSKLQQAHSGHSTHSPRGAHGPRASHSGMKSSSKPIEPLSNPLTDLHALVRDSQHETVDLSSKVNVALRDDTEKPVALTVDRSDANDKEISSTIEEANPLPVAGSPASPTPHLNSGPVGVLQDPSNCSDNRNETETRENCGAPSVSVISAPLVPEEEPPDLEINAPVEAIKLPSSSPVCNGKTEVAVEAVPSSNSSKSATEPSLEEPSVASPLTEESAPLLVREVPIKAPSSPQMPPLSCSTPLPSRLTSADTVTQSETAPELVKEEPSDVSEPKVHPSEEMEASTSTSDAAKLAVESLPTVSSTSVDMKPPCNGGKKKKKLPAKRKGKPVKSKNELKKTKLAKPATVKEKPDWRGPVLRITGSRESPLTVALFNAPRNDDEEEKKPAPPRAQYHFDLRGRARNGLFSSTLSSRYDAKTSDPTWVCVFCKRGPHCQGLGDLFGPYTILREEQEDLCEFSGDEQDIVETQKRGGRNKKSIRANNLVDHFRKMSRKLKRSQPCDTAASMLGFTESESSSSSESPQSVKYEVWAHEMCAVWSPGVCLVDTRLQGLQEAIWHCHQSKCSKCSQMGANLGCIQRNCPNRSHYPCAQETGWHLPLETFISTCHFHLQRT